MAEHLCHVTPNLNYTPIQSQSQILNLTNLDELNEWNKGRFVYLTSNDNVEQRPDWLGGEKNIPDLPEEPDQLHDNGYINDEFSSILEEPKIKNSLFNHVREAKAEFRTRWKRIQMKLHPKPEPRSMRNPTEKADPERPLEQDDTQAAYDEIKRRQLAGRSDAPAVLIVVNKGRGVVDAFWFFFYSYNLGNVVLNVRFGNHVGDWEHTLVRFQHGKPKYVYFSEHNFGEAYSYGAVEKIGKRVRYSHYFVLLRYNLNWYIIVACGLLSNRYTCHVRYPRSTSLHFTLGYSSWSNWSWPSLGSASKFPHLHIWLPCRWSSGIRNYSWCSDSMVLFCGPLGR